MTDFPSIELRPHQQQDSTTRKMHGPFVEVSLSQNQTDLEVTFLIKDPDNLILWPDKVSAPIRKDNLWQQTCFELFVTHQKSTIEKSVSYQEWNFSSSGNWQAYIFKDYRSPTPPQELTNAAQPRVVLRESKLIVLLREFSLCKESFINPTAMIQLKDKTLIAYAYKHPEKGPDFHLQDCFLPWSVFSGRGDLKSELS